MHSQVKHTVYCVVYSAVVYDDLVYTHHTQHGIVYSKVVYDEVVYNGVKQTQTPGSSGYEILNLPETTNNTTNISNKDQFELFAGGTLPLDLARQVVLYL